MSEPAPHVVETTAASFERDAVERSREVPVVVDFWAPWCGPCRMLGPALEKLAAEYGGRFVLVKANTDDLPDAAAAFGVRGIPAVFGLRDGRVRDSFVGVLPERELRNFLDGLMPSPAEVLVADARALIDADAAEAERKLRHAATLESNPNDATARIALAGLLARTGRADEARALVEELRRRGYLEPEAERLEAELVLQESAREAGPLDAARAAAEAAPGDLHAQFRLAEALAATGRHADALGVALTLVERDRAGVGEEARKLMLAVFNLLPPDSELAADYRRQLSFVL
jgi:putative thioredoxin